MGQNVGLDQEIVKEAKTRSLQSWGPAPWEKCPRWERGGNGHLQASVALQVSPSGSLGPLSIPPVHSIMSGTGEL